MNLRTSLRTRFTLAMTLCVVVLYSGTCWLVHSLARRAALKHLDERIEKRLADLITDIDWKEGGLDLDFHFKSPPEFSESSRLAFYELRDPQRRVIVRSYSLGLEESLPIFDEASSSKGAQISRLADNVRIRATGASFRPPLDEDTEPAKITAPLLDSPENVFYLTVAESTAGMDEHLRDMAGALLLGGVFLVAACAAVAVMAARWLNQPIVRVAESVAGIDAASLHKRLPVDDTPVEMRPIISQFNALLDRLNEAMQRERRFSTAIAHELRTPLAELRALADVALIDCDHDSALREDPREVFTQTAALATRMGNLFDLLSAIHRSEDGHSRLQPRELDLRDVTARIDAAFRQSIEQTGRALKVTLPNAPVMVSTDPNVIEAVAANLARNALQHASPACAIEIAVTAAPPALCVRNPTNSLTADDLPRLTEPLWQKDAARTQQDRFGIGLTLCRAYAELIGARLTFSLAGGIFTASLELASAKVPGES